jgi:Endosomal/lysosomal potassium channel TMEM175
MLRAKFVENGIGTEPGFHWRGNEITRFEGLSDAVFGFAVTLLIVSLEVPRTFSELLETMRGFFAFAICFVLLMLIWHQQYIFFRRYGLQDTVTIVLNSALLFVVLFYIYPLKFLFSLLINVWTGSSLEVHLPNGTVRAVIEQFQLPTLMIIYSAGYLAIALVFALLFLHAYRRRAQLTLSPVEIFDTRWSIYNSLFSGGVSVVSILLAWLGGEKLFGVAGLIYPVLMMPGFTILGRLKGHRRHRVKASIAVSES